MAGSRTDIPAVIANIIRTVQSTASKQLRKKAYSGALRLAPGVCYDVIHGAKGESTRLNKQFKIQNLKSI